MANVFKGGVFRFWVQSTIFSLLVVVVVAIKKNNNYYLEAYCCLSYKKYAFKSRIEPLSLFLLRVEEREERERNRKEN